LIHAPLAQQPAALAPIGTERYPTWDSEPAAWRVRTHAESVELVLGTDGANTRPTKTQAQLNGQLLTLLRLNQL